MSIEDNEKIVISEIETGAIHHHVIILVKIEEIDQMIVEDINQMIEENLEIVEELILFTFNSF